MSGPIFAVARLDHKAAPVRALEFKTWEELTRGLTRHRIGPKDGPAWMPARIEPGDRKAERVADLSALALDVEAKCERQPDGAKRVVGPLPPPLQTVAAELELRDIAAALATSYSHEEPTGDGGTVGPRYRITIVPSRPIRPDEVKPLGLHVARLLGIGDAFDAGCLEPARLYYLPRCPADREHLAETAVVEGQPLDVDAMLAAARASATPPPGRSKGTEGASVIDAFNAAHDVAAILESHGYKPAGRDRWVWPQSTTGEPGVVKLPDSARIFSHHGADPLAGEHSHDAFSAWCMLAHGGDMRAAVREAARILGMDRQQPPARPRVAGAPPDTAPDTAPEAWPDPAPLPDGLPPVAAFDAHMLPEALRGWVADIAHRMQCPIDFPAVGAVVALSGLIGARAVVAPKARDDWRVVPNLWGQIVGRPGVMKSPALAQVLAPLQRLEAAEREQWKAAHEAWELDCKVAELAAKQNEKQAAAQASKDPAKARALLQPADLPAEPVARRYLVNDATVEKLADLLTVNPWGLTVFRDELHGLLCAMDRQGQEGARGFYLTGYDGNQGHAVDRVGRGESYVPRVCLAMLGGIQPGKVQSYVREAVAGGAGDDGLLQRFGLTVWPDVVPEFAYVDQWPDTPAKQAAWAVFERLNALQPVADTDPQEWRFTPEAQDLFIKWLVPFETELRGEELHPALVSHLAKYRKLVPALALIFALVDTPESAGLIHDRELIRALAWADYLRTHAERLYAAAVIPETAGAHALLAKIRAGKLQDNDGTRWQAFEPWRVSVKGWAGLTSAEAVRKAANVLADYGWLAREAVPTGASGGRPGERFLVHPALLKRGAA